MNYLSHKNSDIHASFGKALLASLAPDGGLWMPEEIPFFSSEETVSLGAMSFADCAAQLATYFTDENFSKESLKALCRDAYNYSVPMVTLSGQKLDPALAPNAHDFVLELFHGPTLAFKDFAARFMGRSASHLMGATKQKRTILVATSGDTGGAIGDAFLDQAGIKVFILFPKGGFYYFWTSLQAKAAYPKRPIVYSIPSGNLGNLTGGLIAKKMGAPIDRFVIGNNANNPFVDYLKTGEYTPRPSVPTLSNAMDIGRPNNFPRILSLFDDIYEDILHVCWGASFSDDETARHIRRVYNETGYIMCPHTAVGHLAMEAFVSDIEEPITKITVGTAHPAKFAYSVERILDTNIPLPAPLAKAMSKTKRVHVMSPTLEDLSDYLAIHA